MDRGWKAGSFSEQAYTWKAKVCKRASPWVSILQSFKQRSMPVHQQQIQMCQEERRDAQYLYLPRQSSSTNCGLFKEDKKRCCCCLEVCGYALEVLVVANEVNLTYIFGRSRVHGNEKADELVRQRAEDTCLEPEPF